MARVLVVEDDRDIHGLLSRGLEAEGFAVSVAERADAALASARDDEPEVVVLDIGLPDGSGHDVCRSLRQTGYVGAILFLSAHDDVRDRAHGLALGADDYIVKPFDFDELLARVQTQLAMRRGTPHTVITAGKATLDLYKRELAFGEARVRLTSRETDLLALLMRKAGRPLSRDAIFAEIWSGKGSASQKVVDVYLSYLREKLAALAPLGGPVITRTHEKNYMLDLGW